MTLAQSSLADELDPIQAKLDKAKAAYEADIKNLHAEFAETLKIRLDSARKRGDKKLVDQINAERRAFEKSGDLPESVPQNIKSKMNASRERLQRAYRSAIQDFTRSSQDDDATAAESELVEFRNVAAAASESGNAKKDLTSSPHKPWNTPEFQRWMKGVAAMPPEKQLEAVSKKLMELNPRFDGVVTTIDRKGPPKIEKGMVTDFAITTDNVTDISPIRALTRLRRLGCYGSGPRRGQLSDLSPIEGMSLIALNCNRTLIRDLSSLKGMNLWTFRCSDTNISDLSLLQEHKNLKTLEVQNTKVTPAQVAALQKALPNCKIEWDDPSKPKTTEPAASGSK
jgi:hypothetical protein